MSAPIYLVVRKLGLNGEMRYHQEAFSSEHQANEFVMKDAAENGFLNPFRTRSAVGVVITYKISSLRLNLNEGPPVDGTHAVTADAPVGDDDEETIYYMIQKHKNHRYLPEGVKP